MRRVEGKVALITGAASGLGKADAIMLAREGAKIVLTDINESGADVAKQIVDDGGDAMEYFPWNYGMHVIVSGEDNPRLHERYPV